MALVLTTPYNGYGFDASCVKILEIRGSKAKGFDILVGVWPDEMVCDSGFVPNGYATPFVLRDLVLQDGQDLYPALYTQLANYLGFTIDGVRLPAPLPVNTEAENA